MTACVQIETIRPYLCLLKMVCLSRRYRADAYEHPIRLTTGYAYGVCHAQQSGFSWSFHVAER